MLLVVDDVHWMEAEERADLADVVRDLATCPVLFVLSTRIDGDPLDAAWRAAASGCPITTLDMSPLAEDEARALAQGFQGTTAEAREVCVQRAAGNPLFLEQLLHAAAAGESLLPSGVRGLILTRLEHLSPEARQVAQAAAALGQRFPREALASLSGPEAPQAGVLVESGLLRPEGDALAFVHALVRDAVHESLLPADRQRLHQRAAVWFATRDASLAADHLAAAQDPDAASAYLRAADHEAAASRTERAIVCARKARALAREPVLVDEAAGKVAELELPQHVFGRASGR